MKGFYDCKTRIIHHIIGHGSSQLLRRKFTSVRSFLKVSNKFKCLAYLWLRKIRINCRIKKNVVKQSDQKVSSLQSSWIQCKTFKSISSLLYTCYSNSSYTLNLIDVKQLRSRRIFRAVTSNEGSVTSNYPISSSSYDSTSFKYLVIWRCFLANMWQILRKNKEK